MAKNIWYLHHYAGAPTLGMSYRPFYLSKYFNLMDMKATVIGASFHHLLNKKKPQTSLLSFEKIDNVDYAWIKACPYQNNSLGRLRNMFEYSLRLYTQRRKLVKQLGKPDAIIVSSTHLFHYLSAKRIAKQYQAKLIFEVRDLWPLSIIELLDKSPNHPLLKLMSYIERKAYREADYVVSLLANAFTYMKPLGLDEARYRYIPNGVDILNQEDTSALPEDLIELINNLKKQNKFIIVYAGAHGIPNALEQLVDAFTLLQNQGKQQIVAILVGHGVSKAKLQSQAKHLTNVFFHEPIIKTAVPKLLAQADACFLGWRDKALYHYGVSPNKMFDYMLAEKPIIQAINSPGDPVALAKCGLIVPAEQPAELAEAIQSLAGLDKSVLAAMGTQGKNYVLQHHTYPYLAEQYAKLFNS